MSRSREGGSSALTRRTVAFAFGALAAGQAVRSTPAHAVTSGLNAEVMAVTIEHAASLGRLRSLVVARDGEILAGHAFHGANLRRPVNVQSLSKSVLSAVTGAAIANGVFSGVDQTVGSVIGDRIPDGADPRVGDITVRDLLTMQAGLRPTSGRRYGVWVAGEDWVGDALAQPFVDRPGGRMLYSTGNYHVLSAMLTRASGKSTLDLAREWLGGPLNVIIPAWTRDPQGVFMGGNNMELSPLALIIFGEMYRKGGAALRGDVLPGDWIADSWRPRTQSPYTGDGYGYGWFVRRVRGYRVYYGWGYGGQMLYIVPDLKLTVAITSDTNGYSRRSGHRQELDRILSDGIMRAAVVGA